MNFSEHVLSGFYDWRLVGLSILIAIFASYAALDLAGRVTSAQGRTRALWLTGGATAMGIGIWSMHYVGMLAFHLPVPVLYDWPAVLLSLLAAIGASAIALFVVSRATMGFLYACIGSVFMGSGIAGMHYIGMAAMRLPAMCHYSAGIVITSVILAVVISFVAMRLAFHFRGERAAFGMRKGLSAVVMGAAVCTMHYTGMAAAHFTALPSWGADFSHAIGISSLSTTVIIVVTFMVLALTISTSQIDRRFSAQAQELVSSEQRSRQILETSFDAFVSIDSAGNILDWNAQAESIFGWPRANVMRQNFADAVIPVHLRGFYQEKLQQLHGSQAEHALNLRFESRAIRRDTREIPIEVTVSVVDSNGGYSFAAFVRDLSEKERAEEKFSGLLESSSEALLFIDPTGQIVLLNSRAEKLFGYPRAEMLNQKMEMFLPERFRGKHGGQQAGFFKNPAARPMGKGIELYALRKDGSEFPADISLNPLKTENGILVSTVIVDVTIRKEKEQALRDAHEKLRVVLADAEQRAQEAAQLAELLDILQSCQTPDEVYAVAAGSFPALLPSRAGAMCIVKFPGSLAEVVASWGDTLCSEGSFRLEDCWALRRGRVQFSKESLSPMHCAHVTGLPQDGYVCVPLTAQGETLGVLYLECLPPLPGASTPAGEDFMTALARQANIVGERISLALANLRLRELLRQQSIRDPLTGLFNRRYMEETLQRELSRAIRYKESVSLLMVDVDHFKRFNDTHGHQAGDALLRAVGEFLSQSIRGHDVACRYGGEEFAVILAGGALEPACRRAEVLREGIKALAVSYGGKMLGTVTISIGVSCFPGRATTEELVRGADQALYRAKAAGRDRVMVDDEISASTLDEGKLPLDKVTEQ